MTDQPGSPAYMPGEVTTATTVTWLRIPAAAVATISAATCYLLVVVMVAGDWTALGYVLISTALLANLCLLVTAGAELLDDEHPAGNDGADDA